MFFSAPPARPAPARGAGRSAAHPASACWTLHQGLAVPFRRTSWTKLLTCSSPFGYPSQTLPRRPAHSVGPTSWREARRHFFALGRKNCVPRGLQKMINFPMHFDIDFSASWVGFGRPRGFQNPSKIDQNVLPEPYLFRHRFFIDFFILTPKTEPPNFKNHWKKTFGFIISARFRPFSR